MNKNRTKGLLERTDTLSVNQTAALIKLMEMWKNIQLKWKKPMEIKMEFNKK
jgi:hypothetical protein